MKILILNGSPRASKSKTLKIASSFTKGLNYKNEHEVEIVNIYDCNINYCKGCYYCWNNEPGVCVIKDDMTSLIKKFLDADIVIWCFPIYAFGMPSKLKVYLERLLPIDLPTMLERKDGGCVHAHRHKRAHHKYVMICSCGFYSKTNNCEPVVEQFSILYGKKVTKIICTESELFNISSYKVKIDRYLDSIEKAGVEYCNQGSISEETKLLLSKKIVSPELYMKVANESWGID